MWHYPHSHIWLCYLVKINLHPFYKARCFCKDTMHSAYDIERRTSLKFDGVFRKREKKNFPCFSPVTEREQVHMHLGYISIFSHSVHTVEKLSNLTLLNVDTKWRKESGFLIQDRQAECIFLFNPISYLCREYPDICFLKCSINWTCFSIY